ncbi:agamous-like MADS-box protein AP3 [Quercus robur]|uniref:agamous-like MADS-box protein AP3 n=1 Tax=Quercus robur TaxID=38942 RepID=UPI00216353FB|nr:agamous-like MADS-box protein AP3 [Quercus robur]
MARGKIQIKRIENTTNRQVTYSKRRNGLFKKANELTVLCDAKVSIIMVSSTGKVQEYVSPSTTTKQLIDEYQKAKETDIWSSHYERMQRELKKLKEVNRSLRTEIRQRIGESANDLSLEKMHILEQDMENAVKVIRERKYRVISGQTETFKKKLRNAKDIHRNLLHGIDAGNEDPQYGLVDNGGDYGAVIGRSNGDPHIFALRLRPRQPNFHSGAGSDLTTYTLLE